MYSSLIKSSVSTHSSAGSENIPKICVVLDQNVSKPLNTYIDLFCAHSFLGLCYHQTLLATYSDVYIHEGIYLKWTS